MNGPEAAEHLLYALAKQVPDAARGFSVSPDYGDIEVDGENAAPFVALLQRHLEKKYAVALKEASRE